MIIAISGFHGSGKTTCAKMLSEKYGIRFISAGMFFRKLAEEMKISLLELSKIAEKDPEIDRKIDAMIRKEALDARGRNEDLIIEGTMVATNLRDIADLTIFFKATDEIRVKRISKRDGISLADAERETLGREKIEHKRFMERYNVDIFECGWYDLIINTDRLPPEVVFGIVEGAMCALKKHSGG
ncbi:MAG: AAA family ATPase [Candidatus Korarchaeota archaeon]